MRKIYSKEQIISLRNELKTNTAIAEIMKCSNSVVERTLKKEGIDYYNPNKEILLTQIQKEVLYGTLLGDSCVRYVHENCNYPMLTFSHTDKQKEYFNKKYEIFKNLLGNPIIRNINTNLAKNCIVYQATGKNMNCLVDIREMFYKDNIKIIPNLKEFQDNFTEQSLYYLYMDDGCKYGKTYHLSTYCFSLEEQENFCKFIYDKFNIQFNIKKDLSLWVKTSSKNILTDILVKYNDIQSMKYKIQE